MIEFETWLAQMTPMSRAIEEGEIDELFDAAADGKLEDSGDGFTPIKPVTHVPEIFELRRRSGASKPYTYLRFYHSEPAVRPTDLMALHRHIKAVEDDQTDGLAQAIKRHEQGEILGWM